MAKPESPRAAVSTCRRHRRRRSAGVGGSGQARSRRRRRGGEGPAPGGWRAYARGEPGEGALPARAALPARGPPRACHGCGQLPPPLQPADPGVGTRLPRLLRRLEVRAGRGWVAPPPFQPRVRSGPPGLFASLRRVGLPSILQPLPPPASFLASVTHDKASRASARCPRARDAPGAFPGLAAGITTALPLREPPPRGAAPRAPLRLKRPGPSQPLCVSGLCRDCCFLGIWVWDVMGGSRTHFADIHPKARHDPESLGV